jgi:tRNA-dihydrouridine synthase
MVKIRNIELGDFPLLLAPMEDVSDPPFRALNVHRIYFFRGTNSRCR